MEHCQNNNYKIKQAVENDSWEELKVLVAESNLKFVYEVCHHEISKSEIKNIEISDYSHHKGYENIVKDFMINLYNKDKSFLKDLCYTIGKDISDLEESECYNCGEGDYDTNAYCNSRGEYICILC